MKKKLSVFILVLFSIFTALLLSCGKKDKAVTIKFPTMWVGVNQTFRWFDPIMKDFNAKYGDKIKVAVEEIPGDQAYVDKIKVLYSVDDLPDVINTGGYNLLDSMMEKLVDLTPYLESDPKWKESFDPISLEFGSRNGKVYTVPTEKQVIGYFYNKEMFAKAGITPARTWDEWFSNLDKLKAAGYKTPVSMDSIDSGWITMLMMCSMIGTDGDSGNKFMNTSLPKNYNTPEVIKAAKMIQRMFVNYTTADAIGGKYENGANNFFSGKTAIIANGSWMVSDFYEPMISGEKFYEKVGVAMYPNDGMFVGRKLGFMVGSKTKENTDAAVEFVKFLTSKDSQIMLLEKTGNIPDAIGIDVPEAVRKEMSLIVEIMTLADQAKYKYNEYQALWYANVVAELDVELPLLAQMKITPEEFAKKLTETANKN